jgi:hypothetical protein
MVAGAKEDGMSYCTSCGAQVAAGAPFCQDCGAALAPPPQQEIVNDAGSDRRDVIAQNTQYFVAAERVLENVQHAVRSLQALRYLQVRRSESSTSSRNAPPEFQDGTTRADGASYTWKWTVKNDLRSIKTDLPGGGFKHHSVFSDYWVCAIYHPDGSLEIQSADGDIEVAPASDEGATPVRAVLLRGEQQLGRKSLLAAASAAFSHPAYVTRETTGSFDPSTDLDDDTQQGAYGRDQRNW